jgi:hypothetical protein
MKFAVVLLASSLLFAQSPAAVKPHRVSAQCSWEMVQEAALDCSEDQPCPVYLELSDVHLVGSRILVVGNLHTDDTTLQSILLVSDDSGATWTEAHPRILQSALESIQFYDFEVGWIGGQVVDKRPRDAFFLLSSDGGKTWRKKAVFGETRSGTVEKVHFESRTHGFLLFDRQVGGETGMRHELWESVTGGESWNVRQVDSKPIPFPSRAATPDDSLRIRPDAATKSIRIEQRNPNNRWFTISSFFISAGECRPSEPASTLAEPPPLPTSAAPAPSTLPAPSKAKRLPSLRK